MTQQQNRDGCLVAIIVVLVCLAVLPWGLSVRDEYQRGNNPIYLDR